MTDINIGDWAMREKLRVPHYVDSVVAGDIVTRCGARMADTPTKSGGRLVHAPDDLRPCRKCE